MNKKEYVVLHSKVEVEGMEKENAEERSRIAERVESEVRWLSNAAKDIREGKSHTYTIANIYNHLNELNMRLQKLHESERIVQMMKEWQREYEEE